MTIRIHVSVALAMLTTLAACSSSDDDNDITDLDGEYNIEAIALTELDVNGGPCGDASGSMTVMDGEMVGSVLTTNGNSLAIDGTIADNGNVEGGFALGTNAIASFSGSFSGNGGGGDWEDNFGCNGTWTAERL